jgi:serine/threonine protein kinase
MKFLGENNYQDLSFMSFTMKPSFRSSNDIQDCNNFMKRYYFKGNYLLNLSQILQWVNYLFQNKVENINKFFQSSKVLDDSQSRKVVEHSFVNSKLTLIEKQSKVKIEIVSLKNEYFIGIYGMNFLRCQIPSFGFYLFANESGNALSVYQEYVPGKSFRKFIQENEHSNKITFLDQFLSIFLQILLSLEFAQNEMQFTHFDLHSENIIIRPSQNYSYSVKILNKSIKVKRPSLIPTIIDFGYSTCRLENGKIISNMKTHYKYGYYPFFIPGTDIARVLFDLYYLIYGKTSTNYLAIRNLLHFIFEKFYKIDLKSFKAKFPTFLKNYFNISCCTIAYRTPYDLFVFILRNEEKIKSILNIFDIPVEMNSIERETNSSRLDNCFKNLFCINEINNFCNSNVKGFYLNDEKLTFSDFESQLNQMPIPKMNDIPHIILYGSNVKDFLEKYKWFIDFYESLYHRYFIQNNKIPKKFQKNMTMYNRFYKILISFTGFMEFLNLYAPFYAEDVDANLKYCKKLNSLF